MHKKTDLDIGLSGMAWMITMSLGSYGIRLISTYFLARLLTPADYGEMAAISVFSGFAELFWMMGVGPAIVQKKDLNKSDISTGNLINIILGLVICCIINIFAESICSIFSISSSTMLRVYSIVFVLHSFSGVSQSLLQKKCKYNYMSLIKLVGIIIFSIVAITLALLDFKVWALIIATLVEITICMLTYILLEPVALTLRIDKKSTKSLLYFGFGYTIARFFSYVANSGDNFVVNKSLGKILLGAYSKAYQLLMYPVTLVGESLDQVLFPLLSKNQDDSEKLKRVFISGTGLIMLASMPVAIVAFVFAEPIILFALGEQWEMVISPFKILIVGLFFRIGYKLSDSVIRALGKVYQRSFVQAIYAFFVLLGAYIGHYKGLLGVAAGVTFAFTLNYFLMTALSAHYLNLKIRSLVFVAVPSLLYGAVTIIGANVLKSYLFTVKNDFLVCVLGTVVCFGIYGISFIFTRKRILNKEFNQVFDQIRYSITISIKNKLKALKNTRKKITSNK